METVAKAGWTFKRYSASNGIDIPYQMYIPKNLDETKKYPVILFMHGMGSVGSEGEHISQTVARFLTLVTASKYKDEVLIIAPQLPKGHRWIELDSQDLSAYKSGIYAYDDAVMSVYLQAAKELFDDCFAKFPVDRNRIYGYGNSMGAFATFYLACTYPDLYAAIVPVSGGCDPNKASVIKDIPMWVFHGDADVLIEWLGSKTIVENVIALGATNAKLTVFPGVGHDAVRCFVAAAETEGLLDWIFAQSK